MTMFSSRGALRCAVPLAWGMALVGGAATVAFSSPAIAIPVFDSANYAQNLLIAARTLQQINQQIQSLQNEATMLSNMARNLAHVDFPELSALTERMRNLDTLMAQAQGIDFDIGRLEAQLQSYFPKDGGAALRTDARVAAAQARLDAAMAGYRQSMIVQSQLVGDLAEDARTIAALSERSQSADGALQAAQATNQLLALAARQQLAIQTLMATQYRAQSIDQADRLQAQMQARAATRQFLGTRQAYSRP